MKSSYMPYLDVLRAISIIFVVFAHTRATDTFLNSFGFLGSYGVLLFFSISGFLLTFLALKEHTENGIFNIKNFYIRRALRIWPMYFLYLLLATFVSILFNDKDILIKFTLALVFLGNLLNTLHAYLDVPSAGQLFNHLWSLSVEEQFYILFPFIISFITFKKNINLKYLGSILLIIFMIGIIIRFGLLTITLENPSKFVWPGIVFNTFTYLDVILFSILLGVLKYKYSFRFDNKYAFFMTIFFVVLFVIIASFFNKPSSFDSSLMYGFGILGLISGIAVYYASFINIVSRKTMMFVRMGKDSYGIYLFHMPFVIIFKKIGITNDLLFLLVFLCSWGGLICYIDIMKFILEN